MRATKIITGCLAMLLWQAGHPASSEAQQVEPSICLEAQTTQPLWGLVVAGVATVSVPYALTVALTAGLDEDRNDNLLYVPLVGPWLELAFGHDAASFAPLAIPSGIVELCGAMMLIVGLAVRVGPGSAISARARTLAGGGSFEIVGRW